MNIKKIGTLVICISWAFILFSSCTSCQSVRWIKNCTQDTLLIELAASDTLDDWLYWGENPEDTLGIMAPDTFAIYIHGDKIIIKNDYYALPDSLIRADGYVLTLKEQYYYIYAIKWNILKHYTLDEIRDKGLYDRKIVTKKDFQDRVFEYRASDLQQ